MSASVSITDQEFNSVAHAAMELWTDGYVDDAIVLDELARRMNAALSLARSRSCGASVSSKTNRPRVESPLETAGLRKPSTAS